ncbi:MAG TPA: hypothetical protein VMS31_02775 [Pyrinomonadaceae bacterium]|nr:hypothetical protein [Pyrinomonadaceae bacterium]
MMEARGLGDSASGILRGARPLRGLKFLASTILGSAAVHPRLYAPAR